MQRAAYESVYGENYRNARSRLEAAIGKPIANLFELPSLAKGSTSIKTEVLFLERCINLLRPGGRLGIVLPEGIFNNSSMEFLRDFVEGRARIEAVVSVPVDAFVASGATVKTSLLFLRKFTTAEAANWDRLAKEALADEQARRKPDVDTQQAIVDRPAPTAADHPPAGKTKAAKEAAAASLSAAKELHRAAVAAARKRLKEIAIEVKERARRDARKLCRYPIFFYEAQKVGITSTGESDDNELYPNPRAAQGATALEEFNRFKKDHEEFFVSKWACAAKETPQTAGVVQNLVGKPKPHAKLAKQAQA